MQPIRVQPYELVQERAHGDGHATDACEAHWGGGTHRRTLRRRGVSSVRGGAVFPASPPATACGGAVAHSFFSGRALRAERRGQAREGGNGDVRKQGTLGGPIYRLGRHVRAAS